MSGIKKNQIVLNDGKKYFCIPISNPHGNVSLNKFLDFRNSPGFIVHNNKVVEWHLLGITNKDGNPYIFGPNFEGISLEEILKYPIDKSITFLEKIINALLTIEKELNKSLFIQLDNIYFLNNGSILFLPINILEKVKDIDKNYDFKNYSLINNPYLNKTEEKISYNILTLIYRIITKKFPFEGNKEEEIYSKIRNFKIIPPKIYNPEIKEEISNQIVSLFNKNQYKTLSLIEWQKYINKLKEQGITTTITKKEKEEYLEKYKNQEEIINKKYKKKVFWEKNKKKIITISTIIIISSIILFSFLKNIFRPRVTKGFSPKQVVETFYLSINKLDHLTMEDCVLKNAGNSDINEVMLLYLNQKQSLAYTGKSNIIIADEWEKKGRPIIYPPLFVFGILNLEIKEESRETEVIFLASYEKWTHYINENEIDEKRIQYKGAKIKDKLYLKNYKKDWVIYKIDRIEKIDITE